MLTKHTSGPWTVRGEEVLAPNETIIADIFPQGPPQDEEEETKSNARLIAAAPDLLESASAVLNSLNDGRVSPDMRTLHRLAGAINKAEGS